MSTLTFQIEEKKAEMLSEAARERGLRVEELLQQIADDFLSRKESFESAAKYVLQKKCGTLSAARPMICLIRQHIVPHTRG